MADMTVDQLIEKRNELDKTLSGLRNKAAVAKAERERLEAELSTQFARLQSEFGCSDFTDAKKKRDALLKSINSKVLELEARLHDLRDV